MKKIFIIAVLFFICLFARSQSAQIVPGNPLFSTPIMDSVNGILGHIMGSGVRFNQGDTCVIFSDSYGNASGATTTAQGIFQLLVQRYGAIINNQSANGSCIEKRTPTNPFTGVNFIDRLSNLPHFSAHVKYIIIWGGLNDVGENSANYTTANFTTDYTTIMNFITGTLGFPPENIMICSAPWIGSVGQASYATLSGNAAPTTARALTFIAATQAIAQTYGTGYFAPFFYQLHDTTHMSADGIHPNDGGYGLLADYFTASGGPRRIFLNPFVQSGLLANGTIKANYQNMNFVLGDHTIGSITTPNYVDLGKEFAASTGAQANLKMYLYTDGNTGNNCGFAIVPGALEYHAFNAGAHDFYIGNVEQTDLISNKLRLFFNGTTTSTSTATPTAIDMLGSFNSTQGSDALKLFIYHVGAAAAGLGTATNSLYYSVYTAGHHDFYIGDSLYMTLAAHKLTLDSLGGAKVDFNVNNKGLFINPTGITTRFAAGTTAGASINLTPGTNPTSANDGDLTYDGTHLNFQHGATLTDLLAGGSGVTTVGAFSGSSQANGATISTSTITFGPADGTNPGMIKASGSQTLGPTITFTNAPILTTTSTVNQVWQATGTAGQGGWGNVVTSGAYVPVITNGTNVSSSTTDSAFWTRNGNIVTVFGSCSVSPTTGSNTATAISLAVPVASHFATTSLRGVGSSVSSIPTLVVNGNSVTNGANLGFFSGGTGPFVINYSYSYIVQ